MAGFVSRRSQNTFSFAYFAEKEKRTKLSILTKNPGPTPLKNAKFLSL